MKKKVQPWEFAGLSVTVPWDRLVTENNENLSQHYCEGWKFNQGAGRVDVFWELWERNGLGSLLAREWSSSFLKAFFQCLHMFFPCPFWGQISTCHIGFEPIRMSCFIMMNSIKTLSPNKVPFWSTFGLKFQHKIMTLIHKVKQKHWLHWEPMLWTGVKTEHNLQLGSLWPGCLT